MEALINTFKKLSITDNRSKHTLCNDIEILTNLMSNLKISNNQDIDDLIDDMEHLTISDDEILVEFKQQPPFIFKYIYFHCGDVLFNSIPKYCDSF